MELHVSQWKETLSRIGLNELALGPIQDAVDQYAEAVRRVRAVVAQLRRGACCVQKYGCSLSSGLGPVHPPSRQEGGRVCPAFASHSHLPVNAYRREAEITVDTHSLTMDWHKAICAAESLSVVTRQADDPVAKRLRLTLGNGHGVSALVDQIKRGDDDRKQEQHDESGSDDSLPERAIDSTEVKRQARAEWWLNALKPVFARGRQALYDHPAIQAAVGAIEQATQTDEKVLVFGRFTRPLRALVDLLNAREMLRRVEREETWPQTKVHGDPDHDGEDSEWAAGGCPPSVRQSR